MAIIKNAKNSILKVNKRHVVMAKEIEKTSGTIKLVATYGNIELNSTQKIIKNGNIN
ncbi:hypothetical protein SOM12_01555 [Flavobacterium sp. CFBP9031]|jgi:hypothetical protein|uniref:hypothetical protein n=1 Tax=Flavobacterium sp. CFBP9031 TaxID=3096538 RepID=UPI002A6B4A04|nr:hypothetical protein [Flavobacterium sp. CFBP9031]MDY0986080.1 hypothetical protein [Flavobacterium sp. CFBP9031]